MELSSAQSAIGRPTLMAESVAAFEKHQLLRIDDIVCRIEAITETDEGDVVENRKPASAMASATRRSR